jgi:predicted amidohydrolase YtcJ
VHQWNYTNGNQPDADHPTLLATLDKVSRTTPIQLLGNDGHHGAFNSAALALARNAQGRVVGLSKATLSADFAAYHNFIGVDADGNPNGAVNEDARLLLNGKLTVTGYVDTDSALCREIRTQARRGHQRRKVAVMPKVRGR